MNKLLLASMTSCALLVGACDFGSSGGGADPGRSDQLTSDAVARMFSGSDDFQSMQQDLLLAAQLNPGNVEARLFLGGAILMRETQRRMVQGHQMRGTLQRAGIDFVDGATFWDLRMSLADHGQGLFKDDIPTLDEFVAMIEGDVLPLLDALAATLESVPADWEYVVPAERAGLLLELLYPGESHPIRFDYADVQALLLVIDVVRALAESVGILDYDGLSPNELDFVDDPNLDLLAVLVNDHPNFGNLLRLTNLIAVRDRLQGAFGAWDNGMSRLLNETPQQRDEGVISLSLLDRIISDPAQQQQLLTMEAAIRSWLRPMVQAMNGGRFTISTEPDGTPLPASEQVTIDFGELFAGVDVRATYLKTITDPLTGMLTPGVSDLSELTQEMASFGGALASIGGSAPEPAVLQEIPGYALLRTLANVPLSTKSIDGSFGDWAQDRDRIMLRAGMFPLEARPDIGELFAARDAGTLYLYLDEDLAQYLTGPFDRYEITVEWDTGTIARVEFQGGGHSSFGGATYQHAAGANGGIECAFPIVGDWARIEVGVEASTDDWDFESYRGPVFVQAR